MEKIIPVGKFIPYTLNDLSVVIPQASQYKNRIKWFIPQYIKGTPKEVVNNTLVTYDPEDLETKAVLDEYGIKGLAVTPPHSTYKMEAGFKEVKTRLCARMHNDAYIARTDWAQILVDYFNQQSAPQLISCLYLSGNLNKEMVDKIVEQYPCFTEIYQNLEFNAENCIGTPFFSAFFMVAQTYVLKSLYSLVVDINEGRMDREDCLFTLLASIFNIRLVDWKNMFEFVRVINSSYGDFDEGLVLPTESTVIDESNRSTGIFKEVINE